MTTSGTADLVLQFCWDAGGLDLGPVGIRPNRTRLCTPAARDLVAWAHGRAEREHVPAERECDTA